MEHPFFQLPLKLTLVKLKLPPHIEEVTHFLGLTGYYQNFACNYADIMHPLNCLMCNWQPFIWTPEYQASFDMLHSQLTNTPIVQLPDPNKLHLLFTDASKFCYSVILTQACTEDLNKALIKYSLERTPLKVWNLKCRNSDWNPTSFILYITFQPVSARTNVDSLQFQKNVLVSLCQLKNVPFTY